jgi:integral membrane sensor domain MASE1
LHISTSHAAQITMKRNAVLWRVLFVPAYALLAFISMRQRDLLTLSTLFWPPAGLLLAALMLTPPLQWPAWMAAAATLHVLAGYTVAERSVPIALVFALGDLLLCGATAALWRRGARRRPLDSLAGALCFIAVLALNSVLGGWLVALGLLMVAPLTPLVHWYVWSVAAFVGCIIVTPLVVAWASLRLTRLAEQNLPRLWLGLAAAFALLIGTTVVFNSRLNLWLWDAHNPVDLAYAPLLFLALVAVSWGPAATSLTVVGLALIAGSYTSSGWGPFADAAAFSGQPLLAVQGYLGAGALLSLLMCALNADRGRAIQDALSWQAQLRSALYHSRYAAWQYAPATDQLCWLGNRRLPFAQAAARTSSLQAWQEHVHPDDRERVRAWFVAQYDPDHASSEQHLRFLLRGDDGTYHQAALSRYARPDAAGTGARVAGLLGQADLA